MGKNAQLDQLKFYSSTDLSIGYNLSYVYDFLDNFSSESSFSCNEIAAIYNVIKFVENGIFPNDFTSTQISKYTDSLKILKKTLGIFWSRVDNENFSKTISGVDYVFHDDILKMLVSYGVLDRLDIDVIKELLERGFLINTLVRNKEIVEKYDESLRRVFINNIKCAELIIDSKYKIVGGIYLPKTLSDEDINSAILAYINGSFVNPNYVSVVSRNRVPGIKDEIKFKAIQRERKDKKEFFKNNTGSVSYGTKAFISKDQVDPVMISKEGNIQVFSLSEKYLLDNIDNESILKNFTSVIGLVRRGMILNQPAYVSEMSTMEQVFTMHGKNEYLCGISFSDKSIRYNVLASVYIAFLKDNDINIEKVISWFFSTHIKEKFGVENFSFSPSTSDTYYEKVKNLLTEMDGIVNQFNLLVENGKVNTQYLAEISNVPNYDEIKSFCSKKYVEKNLKNEEINKIISIIFSDQSSLCYIDKDKSANSFYYLMQKYNVSYSELRDYQKHVIDWLEEKKIIYKDNNYVKFNINKIAILSAIYYDEAMVYARCIDEIKKEIDNMIEIGWLVWNDRLLTTAESNYFDFCLNNKKYSNGLVLRNKYIHGTQVNNDDNAKFHKSNYIRVLVLLVSLVCKIYDDLVLKVVFYSNGEKNNEKCS